MLMYLLQEYDKSDDTVDTDTPLWNYLRPCYFDIVAQAAINTALPSIDDEEELQSRSNAIKIKYDIQRMAQAKLSTTIKELDKNPSNVIIVRAKQQVEDFLKLMSSDWSDKVTRLARKVVNDRLDTKVVHLPKSEETYRSFQVQSNDVNLSGTDVDWVRYRNVATLVMSHLLLYNKRRSGEIQSIK